MMLRVLLLVLLSWGAVACALDASQVVVVCNADSALSREAAELYCRVRGVPSSQLVSLPGLPKGSELSWEEYQRLVAGPLLSYAELGGWRPATLRGGRGRRVYALVLMPDFPLRIRREAGEKEMRPDNSGASLDSELAVLGYNYKRAGMLANPYAGKEMPLDEFSQPVLAVCRIDGPDRECVVRMIEDPARVEKSGLRGWTLVDSGGPYKEGDAWFEGVAKEAFERYVPLFWEGSPTRLAKGYPLMQGVAFYFGWYTEFADGPFAEGAGDFRFAPGAVACHLHSFSATSLRDKRRWVAALLRRGAAVTFGNVAEPFLGGNIRHDVLYDRLLKGYCLAEAAMMAQPTLSWQWVILGDPLYRPCKPEVMRLAAGDDAFSVWQRLNERARGDLALLRRLIPQMAQPSQAAVMAEMYGAACLMVKNEELAESMFDFAARQYSGLGDRLRCMHRRALAFAAMGQPATARATMAHALELAKGSPWEGAMRACAEALDPKPQPKAPGASSAGKGQGSK